MSTSGSTPEGPGETSAEYPGEPAGVIAPPELPAAIAARGLFQFTIEGRVAPGLFVAGWIAGLLGGSSAFIGLLAGRSLAGILLFSLGMAMLLVGLIFLGGSQAIERRDRSVPYAGPSPILTFGAVVVGWYLAAIVLLTPLQLLHIEIDGPRLSLLGIGLQAAVVVILLRIMVVGTGALTWTEMGFRRPDRAALRDFLSGALLALPVVVVTGLVVLGLVSAVGQQPTAPLPSTGSVSGLLLNLLAGAVIAPVYEELFFRGFTQTAWFRMSGARVAIIRSALLFALIHVIDQSGDTFGATLGVAAVAAGARLPVALVLGVVFNRRGSLWASIGLHATFNAILLILAERAVGA